MSTIIGQIKRAESRLWDFDQRQQTVASEVDKLKRGETPDWRSLDDPSRIQRRLERLGEYDAAKAVVEGTPIDFNPFERIIGASQLSGIEFMERGLVAARAVARVEIRQPGGAKAGYGSGVMISPRLFITNNHVLSSAVLAASSVLQFEYVQSAGGLREPQEFRLRPDQMFRTDVKLDFTIVAVEPRNEKGGEVERRGWCPLIAGSGKAVVGERVNVIQHPGGERMQVTIRDNQIIGVADNFLHYVADTKPGSSGSPVFNDQWEMAALHHSGKPRRTPDGRILLLDGSVWNGSEQDATKIDWEANEGVRVSSIVDHMRALQPTMTRGEQTLWDGVAQPPRPLSIWDLFDLQPKGSGSGAGGQEGLVSHEVDEHGNCSWLFRLSFGPVGGMPPKGPPPLPPLPPAPPVEDSDAKPAPAPAPASAKNLRAAAERLLEEFRHDGPYYDADEDGRAMADYWHGIDWNAAPATLFEALQRRLEQSHAPQHSYQRARLQFLYPAIDLRPDGQLASIYSGKPFDPVELIANELAAITEFAPQEAMGGPPEQLLDNDALWEALESEAELQYNCEHVVCQSWFGKKAPMVADIHHLFACDKRCNSFRNNIPYWQFPPEDEGLMAECGRSEGRTKFEPQAGKGEVARATLYFLVRYPGIIGDRGSELTRSRLPVLLDWHRQFPPGEYERHRNWLTQKAQGNRNPFIDYPDAAATELLLLGFGGANEGDA